VPIAPGDEGARAAANWLAASLDGPDGLLAQALGGAAGAAPESALARDWSAVVVGVPRSPALVVRLTATDASLDPAVAQTRALLDRLRQGALREQDRARAASSLARAALDLSLDPRSRTVDLWRGEGPRSRPGSGEAGDPPTAPAPSLDALRAFAALSLHDDALVIVAARPPRVPAVHPAAGHEASPAGRARNH
jgi:hypothetical protein